jgi:hypothetical protein
VVCRIETPHLSKARSLAATSRLKSLEKIRELRQKFPKPRRNSSSYEAGFSSRK